MQGVMLYFFDLKLSYYVVCLSYTELKKTLQIAKYTQ